MITARDKEAARCLRSLPRPHLAGLPAVERELMIENSSTAALAEIAASKHGQCRDVSVDCVSITRTLHSNTRAIYQVI